MTDIHELLAPLAGLFGTFVGAGHGEYPTIASFDYREELTFGHIPGKPLVTFVQRTSALDDGRPLHSESGFWRIGSAEIELVCAHTTGHVETAYGQISPGTIAFSSTNLVGSPTSKVVTAIQRSYRLGGDELVCELAMAAVDEPLTHHLRAELHRA